jgi:hypothetical protein
MANIEDLQSTIEQSLAMAVDGTQDGYAATHMRNGENQNIHDITGELTSSTEAIRTEPLRGLSVRILHGLGAVGTKVAEGAETLAIVGAASETPHLKNAAESLKTVSEIYAGDMQSATTATLELVTAVDEIDTLLAELREKVGRANMLARHLVSGFTEPVRDNLISAGEEVVTYARKTGMDITLPPAMQP